MPMLRRCGGMATTDVPSIAMSPAVGVSKPAIIISVVVLPEPLGPEQRQELARADVERDAVHRADAVVALLQAGERRPRRRDR